MPVALTSEPRTGCYSFGEFCALIPDGQKADLIDGVIHIASPDSVEANRLNTWLAVLLFDFNEYHNLGGMVHISRVAFRLDDKNGPEPDISYVRKERLHLAETGYYDGPPDLAVEIVSPDSVARDYEKKLNLYETHGVEEYWIIDEYMKRFQLNSLGDNGKYESVQPVQGKYQSKVLPGFWLRAEWLWTDSRSRKTDALSEIFSE